MRPAFNTLLSVFTAGNTWSNKSEVFLSFSRTSSADRVKQQSRGMAGLGHVLPWKSSADNGVAACGVMVCSPYNCGEADWLA